MDFKEFFSICCAEDKVTVWGKYKFSKTLSKAAVDDGFVHMILGIMV